MKRSIFQLCCAVAMCATPWVVEAQQVRIMPVGDSITQGVRGQCGYRAIVSQVMASNTQCNVTFVGTRTGVGSSNDPNEVIPECAANNTPHESVPGARADFFLPNLLRTQVRDLTPDYVIIHAGSNDLFQNQPIAGTVQEINSLIDNVFAGQPTATVILMNLIPWSETSPNPDQFSGFSQPDREMEEVTRTFARQLEQLANTRSTNGDNIILVDVSRGFDNNTMTLDGVHPNDNGENFIAYRVLDALYENGVCGNSTSPFVGTTIPSNQWVQLSIPGDPGTNNTVADIFSNFPLGRYNDADAEDTWVVYRYNPGANAAYELLALNSEMEPGVGYWIVHTGPTSVTVNMPQGSRPVILTSTPECLSDDGCATIPLPGVSDAAVTFNLTGFPLIEPVPLSDTRIDTTAGPCAASGCTPTDAELNNVFFGTLFNYDPSASGFYRLITGSDQLRPWTGYWTATAPDAVNNAPTWLVGPAN